MGKKTKKAKSESMSPNQELATIAILQLAGNYGVEIVNAPSIVKGRIIVDGQRAVRKQFVGGNSQKPDIRFSMWANRKDNNERVLAVLKLSGDALSIKKPQDAIRTVK